MTRTQLTRYTGLAALATGSVAILAILSLIVFYMFQAPQAFRDAEQGISGFYFFGFLNDLLTLVAALPLLALVVSFYQLTRERTAGIGIVAMLLGLIGASGIVATMTFFVFHVISLTQQAVFFIISFGPLGLWHITTNYYGRREQIVPLRLARFGIVVGLGELIAFIAFFLFGGLNLLNSTDYQSLMTNYPLVIGIGIGGFLGYLGGPVWAVWLGRVFLSKRETGQSAI